jgi:metal-responsive CopG/Arc/MetJ family transcriptional regulator
MNERLTTDDLRGMLPSEIVERFDAIVAKLAASEAARAALVAVLQMHVGKNGHTQGCTRVSSPVYPCSKRCQVKRAAIAEQPAAPAPGTEDRG